jgi:hypothetical protein
MFASSIKAIVGAALLVGASVASAQTVTYFQSEFNCNNGAIIFSWDYSNASSVVLQRNLFSSWSTIYQGAGFGFIYNNQTRGTTSTYRLQACSGTTCGDYQYVTVQSPLHCVTQ